MKTSSEVGTDPTSEEVVAAERLLAARSTRRAEIGGDDSSLGDLIRVVIGDDVRDALALIGIELDVLAAALEHPSAARELPLREFVGALARRDLLPRHPKGWRRNRRLWRCLANNPSQMRDLVRSVVEPTTLASGAYLSVPHP